MFSLAMIGIKVHRKQAANWVETHPTSSSGVGRAVGVCIELACDFSFVPSERVSAIFFSFRPPLKAAKRKEGRKKEIERKRSSVEHSIAKHSKA